MGSSSGLSRGELRRRIFCTTVPLLTLTMIFTTGVAGFCGLAACRQAAGFETWSEACWAYRWTFVATIAAEAFFLAVGVAVTCRLARRVVSLTEGMRELVRVVLHDLQTPLAQMRNVSERMIYDEISPQEAAERIAEQCDRLVSVIGMNAEIARLESVDDVPVVPVDLTEVALLATELFSSCADEAGLAFEVALPDRPLVVSGDRPRLQRLVSNLIDNAIKFTPQGGRIRIGLAAVDGKAVLTVTDTGVGMSAETQARMFDRFYRSDVTRRQAGFGLGLSLVRAVVRRYNGVIACTSAEGRGTTFVVTFALRIGNPSPQQTP